MTGCAKPVARVIEDEILKDWELNKLDCVAKLVGYMVDSYEGFLKDLPRLRKDIMPRPPHLVWGKRHKGRYLVKVSECLEKDIMNTLIENVKFGQRAASTVFRNLTLSLKDVHDAQIVHKDLKVTLL